MRCETKKHKRIKRRLFWKTADADGVSLVKERKEKKGKEGKTCCVAWVRVDTSYASKIKYSRTSHKRLSLYEGYFLMSRRTAHTFHSPPFNGYLPVTATATKTRFCCQTSRQRQLIKDCRTQSIFLSNLVPRAFSLAWGRGGEKALGTRLLFVARGPFHASLVSVSVWFHLVPTSRHFLFTPGELPRSVVSGKRKENGCHAAIFKGIPSKDVINRCSMGLRWRRR